MQSPEEGKERQYGWSSEDERKSSAKWGEEVERAGPRGLRGIWNDVIYILAGLQDREVDGRE